MQFALFNKMEKYFSTSIANAIKLLLEEKHLYQNVEIEPLDNVFVEQQIKELFSAIKLQNLQNYSEFIKTLFSEIEWAIRNPFGQKSLPMNLQSDNVNASIEFIPPTVKLFCRNCKRIEAYNFQYGGDLLKDNFSDFTTEQVFSLAYQCQSCKSKPEIFVLHRNKLKLIQSGRVPMEEIETPACLPKKQTEYFSDAIIAFNSGQTLAGNFLLRVFIEQYVRSVSSISNSTNIDELFSNYSKNLPDDFKQRFPSLKTIYDKLSNDMHLANASKDIFNESRNDIVIHFEAKKLYKI
jgi:hypothetical protein